jgi:hypothetical protein
LVRVYPLAGARRLVCYHGLLNLRLRLVLDRRGWRLEGGQRWLLIRGRRGRLHCLG